MASCYCPKWRVSEIVTWRKEYPPVLAHFRCLCNDMVQEVFRTTVPPVSNPMLSFLFQHFQSKSSLAAGCRFLEVACLTPTTAFSSTCTGATAAQRLARSTLWMASAIPWRYGRDKTAGFIHGCKK